MAFEQLGQQRRGVREVLEVVEYEQQRSAAERAIERLTIGFARDTRDRERVADQGRDPFGIGGRGE